MGPEPILPFGRALVGSRAAGAMERVCWLKSAYISCALPITAQYPSLSRPLPNLGPAVARAPRHARSPHRHKYAPRRATAPHGLPEIAQPTLASPSGHLLQRQHGQLRLAHRDARNPGIIVLYGNSPSSLACKYSACSAIPTP